VQAKMRGSKGQRDLARDEFSSLPLQAGLLAVSGYSNPPPLAAREIGGS